MQNDFTLGARLLDSLGVDCDVETGDESVYEVVGFAIEPAGNVLWGEYFWNWVCATGEVGTG